MSLEPVSANPLPQKVMARFVVKTKADESAVLGILRDLDEYEFENYYPEGLVTVFDSQDDIVMVRYTGKYEVDLNKLQLECWKLNIPLMVLLKQKEIGW